MTQVFLINGSTSPWAVPSNFTAVAHTVDLLGGYIAHFCDGGDVSHDGNRRDGVRRHIALEHLGRVDVHQSPGKSSRAEGRPGVDEHSLVRTGIESLDLGPSPGWTAGKHRIGADIALRPRRVLVDCVAADKHAAAKGVVPHGVFVEEAVGRSQSRLGIEVRHGDAHIPDEDGIGDLSPGTEHCGAVRRT